MYQQDVSEVTGSLLVFFCTLFFFLVGDRILGITTFVVVRSLSRV